MNNNIDKLIISLDPTIVQCNTCKGFFKIKNIYNIRFSSKATNLNIPTFYRECYNCFMKRPNGKIK